MDSNSVQLIAISGVSNGGKTTLTEKIFEKIPSAVIFHQDDYYYPVGTPCLEYVDENPGFYNWDTFSSLNLAALCEDVKKCYKEMKEKCQGGYILVDGHLILNYRPLEKMFTAKYYIRADKEVLRRRRANRVYDPPNTSNYFEKCAWPMYQKFLADIQENIHDVVFLNGNLPTEENLNFIMSQLDFSFTSFSS